MTDFFLLLEDTDNELEEDGDDLLLEGLDVNDPVTTLRVRELPPLRLHTLVTTPGGYTQRWAQDEPKSQNVPHGLGFDSSIPGGHDSFDCELPRKTNIAYGDLERLSDVEVRGVGGEVAWKGRLEKAPRASGDDRNVNPQALGYQAHLDDDNTAAEVYISRAIDDWQGMSAQRKLDYYTALYDTLNDGTVETDTSTGAPALSLRIDGDYVDPATESWYDAGPACRIARVLASYSYAGLASAFTGDIRVADDDVATNEIVDTDRVTGASGSGTLDFTPSTPRRWMFARLAQNPASDANAVDRYLRFTNLRWIGNHGLTLRGTAPNEGVFASDVIANAISRWAPLIKYTTGVDGSIQPTSFPIPELAFRDGTTVAEIIGEANRYALNDWAVWTDPDTGTPKFYYYPRGGGPGKKWQARIGPAKLQETGPAVDRLWNGVLVLYRDAAGSTKTIGPTGSLADSTSSFLIDTDPLNPANVLGIKRYAVLDMGILSNSTAAGEVGRRFLEESKALDQSGSAELQGHVTDDHGVVFPAFRVRAGDQIRFLDASDTSYRRVVKASYSDDDKSCSVDLDAPPEGMDALLERLSASLLYYHTPPAPPNPYGAGNTHAP